MPHVHSYLHWDVNRYVIKSHFPSGYFAFSRILVKLPASQKNTLPDQKITRGQFLSDTESTYSVIRHTKEKKYTFINANIKVINTILKVNTDNRQTLKCKRYSLTFLTLFAIQQHSWTTLGWMRQTLVHLYNQLSVLYI